MIALASALLASGGSATTWNVLSVIGIVSAVAAPISGVVVAIIVNRRTKQERADGTTTAMRAVSVDEKEAHTHEIAVMIEGFATSLENMRLDLAEARAQSASAHAEAASARQEAASARAELSELKIQLQWYVADRLEMIRHIVHLEDLIPTPPGPPTRPTWRVDPHQG